jgi:tetratricopeptide (TPR) repeat protein
MVAVVWFKNIDVVRADMYLKEGDRYRSSRQWDQAIVLHEKARSIDSDEDFYYLMLALDYQLMAQDQNLDQAQRQLAWEEGERIALEARRINPYNPDNTGNMGRYYFTLGQVFDPQYFTDALLYFRKATTLAPSNVIYHNLWAQTHYILQDYDSAIERLEKSLALDPRYPPTWLLLGDTYAATGNVDEALEAHSQAMSLNVRGSDGFAVFADQFLEQRLRFYISAGRVEDIVAAMEQVAAIRPNDARIPQAIGRAYLLAGQQEKALSYLEQARSLGTNSDRLARELANTYLSLNRFDEALNNYQLILQSNPNDVEAHSGLAFIYAQQGRLEEAIAQNEAVLQLVPNDYDSLKNLAILYQQRGQWREALEAAQQAEAVAPETDKPSWQQFITDIEQQIAATG